MEAGPKIRTLSRGCLSVVAVVTLACQAEQPEEEVPEQAMAPAGVRIASPADGSEVMGSSVEIRLEVEGLDVVPAGTEQANSGHHHLFIDTDLTPVGAPIPADQPEIIHMGDASTSRTLDSLSSGEHRIIAVLGDHLHVRLPVATDTVTVVVPE